MPLTQLDFNAALIVIDLQKGIVSQPLAHPAAEIVDRSARLAKAFRKRGLPVALVNVTAAAAGRTDAGSRAITFEPDWTELVPELDAQGWDFLISKQAVGAFIGTELNHVLRERGVTQVFLTGISTTGGVESTGRSARDLGYNVVFVLDAMTDRELEDHRFTVEKIFPRFGETTTTEILLRALQDRDAA